MQNNDAINCCTEQCDRPLDKNFWDTQWQEQATGWDLGAVSPPLAAFIDSITDKNADILIPGCGNAYEASYLIEKGFTSITLIDISPTACELLANKFQQFPQIKIYCEDFFAHNRQYDFIIEQTFFCALNPALRVNYSYQMYHLLKQNGILFGLLFNRTFEKAGPPFGGNEATYLSLFKGAFDMQQMDTALNSITPRAGTELFFVAKKNANNKPFLYSIEGVTCTGCSNTITEKLSIIQGIKNGVINNDFTTLLIVSENEIPLAILQDAVSYDEKYVINPLH